jgi:serine/threonine protein kinase
VAQDESRRWLQGILQGAAGAEPGTEFLEGNAQVTGLNGKTYGVIDVLSVDDFTVTFVGDYEDEENGVVPVRIKVAINSSDNGLVQNEAEILREIDHYGAPKVLDTLYAEGRAGNVFPWIENGIDFIALRERSKFIHGVPAKEAAWMMSRLLELLATIHHQGIIHGGLLPAGLTIVPQHREVKATSFLLALKDPGYDYIKAATEHYSAPEVFEKLPARPAADIFSLGKCVVFILGGDPVTGQLPISVPEEFANLIHEMTLDDIAKRGSSAIELYDKLDALRIKLFGPKEFVPFEI